MILEVSKNGAFIPESEEVLKYIHPSDELPEGVYESIRTYYDRPFRLKEHLKRLKHSADLLGMKLPYDRERILSWTLESIEKNKGVDQFLKVIATAADVLIFSRKLQLDRSIYQGVRATLVNGIRPNPKAKSLSVMTSHEAAEQAKVGSFYEALLVNDEGYCTEGAYSNLFWSRDGQLFTTLESALPGITQQAVMDASGNDIPVLVERITRDEISRVDELFLTKTSTGIVPIVNVDGEVIADGKPGPLTQELMKRLDHLTKQECTG